MQNAQHGYGGHPMQMQPMQMQQMQMQPMQMQPGQNVAMAPMASRAWTSGAGRAIARPG